MLTINTTFYTKAEVTAMLTAAEDRMGRAETIEESLRDHYVVQELRKALIDGRYKK